MAERTPFIGRMDRRVRVFRLEKTVDHLSNHKEIEQTVSTPYAYMQELGGGNEVEGKEVIVYQRSYTIWRNPDIAADGRAMRLTDKGVTYEIVQVKEIGRSHLELVVAAYE